MRKTKRRIKLLAKRKRDMDKLRADATNRIVVKNMTRKKSSWTCTTVLHNMLGEPGRFEPPWDWKPRFTLDELEKIYFKLFGYDWFHDMKKPESENPQYRHYEVGGSGWYGYVKLKDGGRARLEFVEIRKLDWLLYNGYEFAFDINNNYKAGRLNPLWHKEMREEVMIILDLLQKDGG